MAATVLIAVAAGWLYWVKRESPIATAVGEQRSLTLSDGTRIFLNTETRLFVRESETAARMCSSRAAKHCSTWHRIRIARSS